MDPDPAPTAPDDPASAGPGRRRPAWWALGGAFALIVAAVVAIPVLGATTTTAHAPAAAPLESTTSAVAGPDASAAPLLTHLFTRTTASGIALRVYQEPATPSPTPTPTPTPPPTTTPAPTPCPVVTPAGAGGSTGSTNATSSTAGPCRPVVCGCPSVDPGAATTASAGPCDCVVPCSTAGTAPTPATCAPACAGARCPGGPATPDNGSAVAGGRGGSPAGVQTTPVLTVPTTTPDTTSTTTTTTTTKTTTPDTCQATAVVLELSDAGAVATTDVTVTTGLPAPLAVAGSGTFGTAEGAPASWVAVSAGPGVAEVRLVPTTGGGDQMAPVAGLAVLATAGADLDGASVQALAADGTVVSTVGVDGPTPLTPVTCPGSTTPTVPPSPGPSTTTSTTVGTGGPVPTLSEPPSPPTTVRPGGAG